MARLPAVPESVVAQFSKRTINGTDAARAYAQSQGLDWDIHAIPAGSRLVSAFGAYTSGSRHREHSFIVTSEGAERAEIIGWRPLGDRREIMRNDILDNITRNSAQQPQKESALDMIDRAAALRRGAIQTVQKSLHSMEARAAAGQRPTTLSERFTNHRIGRALEERLPGLADRLRRHGEAISRIAKAGTVLAERLAAIARRGAAKRQTEAEYWRAARRAGETIAPAREQAETQRRVKKRGLSR
jgi:hypothetical protein